MARILLINPVHAQTRIPFPSIGLTYIAAALKEEGADVECLDFNLYRPILSSRETEEKIAARRFDVAAIGSMITSYKYVKNICGYIARHHPGAEIWVGGSVVSPVPKLLLSDITSVDVGILNEGDETVRHLYRAKKAGGDYGDVSGIVYRRDGEIVQTTPRPLIADLDTLPLPDWSIYQLRGDSGYISRHKSRMYVITHRGCPFECTYCYHERGSRAHSVDRVIQEVCRFVDDYGAKKITMADDLFCVNPNWIEEFCVKLIDLKLGIAWNGTARANTINPELLALMKESGCDRVDMGFETASPRILKSIQKGLTPECMSGALRMCREAGVRPSITFMIGNEGEDVTTIAESVEFMKRELLTSVMFFATPYPGTPMYDSAKRRGLIQDEFELFSRYGEQGDDLALNLTDFSDDELRWLQKCATRDVRRHYDKEHYRRIARERLLPATERVAVIGNGYEAENMLIAYRDLFSTLGLFVEELEDRASQYRGVRIQQYDDLDTSDFDALVVADRSYSPATERLICRADIPVINPYDDAYFFSKCM